MKTFSLTTRKNVAAVLLGPLLLAPVLVVTYFVLALLSESPTQLRDVVGIALFVSLWALIIAYPAALILGVPTILLLKRFSTLNYFSVLATAVIWSIPIAFSFGIDFPSTLLVGYCAAIVATGCWLVYKYV
jgi:hypothetical protein